MMHLFYHPTYYCSAQARWTFERGGAYMNNHMKPNNYSPYCCGQNFDWMFLLIIVILLLLLGVDGFGGDDDNDLVLIIIILIVLFVFFGYRL
jgi:hypothetical protein